MVRLLHAVTDPILHPIRAIIPAHRRLQLDILIAVMILWLVQGVLLTASNALNGGAMKYTPLDIQRREFEKAFRGLEEAEVRTFLHEIAAEWEELLAENQKLRRRSSTAGNACSSTRTRTASSGRPCSRPSAPSEDVLDGANREKDLILHEAQFKADEVIRDAQQHVVEMEVQIRNLKMERTRFVREMESLMDRTRRLSRRRPRISIWRHPPP